MSTLIKADCKAAVKSLNKSIIWHPQLIEVYERSMALFEEIEYGLDASGFFICGPTGAGKTTLTKMLRGYAMAEFGKERVVYARPNGSVTSNQMMMEILKSMGDVAPGRGTEGDKRNRIIEGLNCGKVKLVILDEFQHLLAGEKTSVNKLSATANAIKGIFDDTEEVSFLIVGLDDALALWNQDPQLRRRLQTPFNIDYVPFMKGKTKAWESAVSDMNQTLAKHHFKIDCDHFVTRMYAATRGSIANCHRLLSRSLYLAAKNQRYEINMVDLTTALRAEIDQGAGFEDGFRGAFSKPLKDVQLALVVPRTQKMAPRRAKGTNALTI